MKWGSLKNGCKLPFNKCQKLSDKYAVIKYKFKIWKGVGIEKENCFNSNRNLNVYFAYTLRNFNEAAFDWFDDVKVKL